MSIVNRCVCFNITFSEIKTIVEQHNCKSIQDIQKHISLGYNCGMCLEYMAELISTGKTEFKPK
jgi:bacterioferritin-associated ferredoxin